MKALELVFQEIVGLIDKTDLRILSRTELRRILLENQKELRLPENLSTNKFINFLVERQVLNQVILDFPTRKETRYLRGLVSEYELALSIKPKSYLSHFSAAFIHGLTEQIPKTIYLNQEQPPKPRSTTDLTQDSIDFAFRQSERVTNNKAQHNNNTFVILNGMHTGNLGVEEIKWDTNTSLRVTTIERTLIDICVRPFYSGGVFQVLDIYKQAKKQLSILLLQEYLNKLNYVYPYHQAIGFYLECANYPEDDIEAFSRLPMKFNFYLTNKIKNPSYSKKWRLFYPEGFQQIN